MATKFVFACVVCPAVFLLTIDAKSVMDIDAAESLNAQGVTEKVVELLKELKGRLTKDGEADETIFSEYKIWADAEIGTSSRIIDEKEDSLAGLKADVERLSATITSSNQALTKAGNELYLVDKELKDATKVREKERHIFTEDEKKAIDANDQLDRAVETMSKVLPQDDSSDEGTGLVQKDNSGESLASAAKKIRTVLFEGKDFKLSFSQREMIDGFVQSTMDVAPTRLRKSQEQTQDVLAPAFLQTANAQQASGIYGSYDPQAGGVIGILKSSRDKAKKQLETLRTDESKAMDAFTQLQKGLSSQIKSKEDERTRARLAISGAEQDMSKAKTNTLAEQEILVSSKKRLQDVRTEFAQKEGDYGKRKALRADEVTAVTEATGILESPKMQALMDKFDGVSADAGTSFVQTASASTHLPAHISHGPHGLALLEVRMTARRREYTGAAPFSKVKTLIQEMLEKLLGEQNKDTEKHGFCTKQLGTTEHELNEKTKWVKKYKSQIDGMDAELVELSLGIKEASEDVRQIEALMTNATLVRGQESTEARVAIQDYASAKTLVKNAMRMLSKVYGSEGKSTKAAAHLKNEESTSGMGGGVIAILEIAVDNYEKLHEETSLGDKKAAREYTELKNSREVQSAKLQKDLEWRKTMEVKLNAEKSRAEKDVESYGQQVTALDEMMGTLKASCTSRGDSYSERKGRREAELKSLKDALDILGGEAIP